MKNIIIRYITIIVICIVVYFFIRQFLIFYIFKNQEKHRIAKLKKMDIDGIVEDNIYNGKEEGYDYYLTSNTFIFGKYYFDNNNLLNLEIGDSVSKTPNKLVLEIYRKDESGKYQYIGDSQ